METILHSYYCHTPQVRNIYVKTSQQSPPFITTDYEPVHTPHERGTHLSERDSVSLVHPPVCSWFSSSVEPLSRHAIASPSSHCNQSIWSLFPTKTSPFGLSFPPQPTNLQSVVLAVTALTGAESPLRLTGDRSSETTHRI